MKKFIALLLAVLISLSLCACGKSEAAKTMDEMIANIGEVTLESEDAIVAAETMYAALTDEQKGELENYALLVSARMTLDKLIEESIPTKEEMLETAKFVSVSYLNTATRDNLAKAKQSYCNQVLEVYGEIYSIEEDHIVLSGGDYYRDVFIDIYLPLEELLEMERFQWATFVGLTTDSIEKKEEKLAGYTFNYTYYKMENAYFVNNTKEITGEFLRINTSMSVLDHGVPYTFDLDGNIYLDTVYIPKSIDTSDLSYGDKITFTAKEYTDTYYGVSSSNCIVMVEILKVE